MFIVSISLKNHCNLQSVISVQATVLIYKQHLAEHPVASTSSSSFGTTTLCGVSPSQPGSSVLSSFLPVFFIFTFIKSSMTSSCHRCLGLPTGLVPIGFQSNSFLVHSLYISQPFDSLYLNESHYICTFYQFISLHVVSYSPYIININRTKYRGFMITLSHTRFGGTPLDERSARRRDLHLTTHNTHKRQTYPFPGGIRTRDPQHKSYR